MENKSELKKVIMGFNKWLIIKGNPDKSLEENLDNYLMMLNSDKNDAVSDTTEVEKSDEAGKQINPL